MSLPEALKCIMYVDDDAEDRLLFEDALKSTNAGYIFQTAADGVEALEYLNQSTIQKPWLLIVDLNMPRMDGKELIRQIKMNSNLSSIPMVALTTSASADDRTECARYGVDMHTKPITFEELKETVVRILKNR